MKEVFGLNVQSPTIGSELVRNCAGCFIGLVLALLYKKACDEYIDFGDISVRAGYLERLDSKAVHGRDVGGQLWFESERRRQERFNIFWLESAVVG